MQNIIEKIKKAGENRRSNLQRLGSLLHDVALELDGVIDGFTAHGIKFKNLYPQSNVGYYGCGLWTAGGYDDDGYEASGKLLSTTDKPGSDYFLHNDFNSVIVVASGEERREAAKNLPAFLNALLEHLEATNKETIEAAAKIEAMVNAAKAATEV